MEIPAIAFLNPNMPDNARLVSFVAWTEQFLNAFVIDVDKGGEARKYLAEDVSDDLLKSIGEAWRELRESGAFNSALQHVKGMPEERMATLGLTKAQLRHKLGVVEWTVRTFGQYKRRGLFRRALEAIDNVLKSVLDGLPGGHAIVELKESLEPMADGG